MFTNTSQSKKEQERTPPYIGLRVCCIGRPEHSFALDGCDDLRSRDLSETRTALQSIKLLAGGSSAPMHLASLCGVPIVVWWKADPVDTEIGRARVGKEGRVTRVT